MTEEQIDIINQSIFNLKLLCKSMKECNSCPMADNCCMPFPVDWEEVKYEEA